MKKFFLHRVCDLMLASDNSVSLSERVEFIWKSIIAFGPIALILDGFDAWFDSNVKFFAFAIISIMINMFFGGWMHWKKGSFSIEQFIKKTVEMCVVLIVAYMILEFVVNIAGHDNIVGNTFEKILQISTLLYPGGKILKNCFILTKGKYPPEFIMDKIYNFQKNGDLSEFLNTKKSTEKQEM